MNGKNKKEIVHSLGKLSDAEADQWRHLLKLAKQSSVPTTQIAVTANKAYLNVAAAHEAWKFWRLDEFFDRADKKKREVSLSDLAAILTINRCIDPASKSQVPVWMKDTALDLLLDVSLAEINPSRIFRELEAIEACKDALVQHLYAIMNAQRQDTMKKLFYDLSSTTFSGSRCTLMRWGHCKEGYDNHMVLALIVNTDGLPIYWEVLQGNTADATTIAWLQEQLQQKLPGTSATMVFDRGMVSDDNLTLLETAQTKYITAMDKNQIESVVKMDFKRFENMTEASVREQVQGMQDFRSLDDVTYYKEIGNKMGRRYVLCFNSQLFSEQRQAREQHLAELHSFVNEQNQLLQHAKRDRTEQATQKKFDAQIRKFQLQGFVSVKLTADKAFKITNAGLGQTQSYQGKIHVSKAKEREVKRLDGFWLLVTNVQERDAQGKFLTDAASLVQAYREKVVIESSFRDIKSCVEVGPVYVWKDKHVKAHYSICVLAHLLNRTIDMLLRERQGSLTKDVISHVKLYEELASCQMNSMTIGPENTYMLTTPSARHQELLGRVSAEHLTHTSMVTQLNSIAKTRQGRV